MIRQATISLRCYVGLFRKKKFLCIIELMNKGFTLVELLVVIAIGAIIASIALGGIYVYQPYARLASVCRDLLTDIRYAQQLSVAGQGVFGVKFFVAENKYQLLRFAGSDTSQILEKTLPQGVSFQGVSGFLDNEVRFNSYGAVSYGGVVSLGNSNGDVRGIDVGPSGFSKIF